MSLLYILERNFLFCLTVLLPFDHHLDHKGRKILVKEASFHLDGLWINRMCQKSASVCGEMRLFAILVEYLRQHQRSKGGTSGARSADPPVCFILAIRSCFRGLKRGRWTICPGQNTHNQLKMTQCGKTSRFDQHTEQIGSHYSTFPAGEAMVLLILWPPVWQVNNAHEENGRKRRRVRLQPHDNK